MAASGVPYSQMSQSAFAGYGLEVMTVYIHEIEDGVAIRFRWIWVGSNRKGVGHSSWSIVAIRFRWIWVGRNNQKRYNLYHPASRNPLSLDMGWKPEISTEEYYLPLVAIRFRWIWVGRIH